jgi:hypothetical protein
VPSTSQYCDTTLEEQNSPLLGNGGKQVPLEMYTHATVEEPVSEQRMSKHETIRVLFEAVFSVYFLQTVGNWQ